MKQKRGLYHLVQAIEVFVICVLVGIALVAIGGYVMLGSHGADWPVAFAWIAGLSLLFAILAFCASWVGAFDTSQQSLNEVPSLEDR